MQHTPHPDQSKILRHDRVLVNFADNSADVFFAYCDSDGTTVKSYKEEHPRAACVRLLPLCRQCSKEMSAPVTRQIRQNRQSINLTFCSDLCAGHYQMGCEG